MSTLKKFGVLGIVSLLFFSTFVFAEKKGCNSGTAIGAGNSSAISGDYEKKEEIEKKIDKRTCQEVFEDFMISTGQMSPRDTGSNSATAYPPLTHYSTARGEIIKDE